MADGKDRLHRALRSRDGQHVTSSKGRVSRKILEKSPSISDAESAVPQLLFVPQ